MQRQCRMELRISTATTGIQWKTFLGGNELDHSYPTDFAIYLNQDSFGSGIYPKTSCELNCTSKGLSCNFLDLTVRQSPQGLSCDIFDKRSQPEYAGIEMIRVPHVHSNISMTAKLGVINSQFYRFLRLRSCKKFSAFQMVSLIVFLKANGYPLKVLLKTTRGLVLKEKLLFGISAFGIFRMILLQVM
jgi:hypothetical protein